MLGFAALAEVALAEIPEGGGVLPLPPSLIGSDFNALLQGIDVGVTLKGNELAGLYSVVLIGQIGSAVSTPIFPDNGYVTEDGGAFYVTEDGAYVYVHQ